MGALVSVVNIAFMSAIALLRVPGGALFPYLGLAPAALGAARKIH
jgi:hypothetical protein